MNFFKKRTKEDQAYDDDAFYDDEYYGQAQKETAGGWDGDEPVLDSAAEKANAGVSFAGGSASPVALKVMKPQGYDDGPEIADYLAGGSTVLLNIEQLDKVAAKRLLDFLLGATHVLGGTMNMVAKGTFVFAPRSVGVSDLTASAEPETEPEEQL